MSQNKAGKPLRNRFVTENQLREAGGHPDMPPQLGGPYGNLDQTVKRTIRSSRHRRSKTPKALIRVRNKPHHANWETPLGQMSQKTGSDHLGPS